MGERGDSNPRPLGPQPSALSAELRPPSPVNSSAGTSPDPARPAGIEPATPSLEGSCSVRLSYGRLCIVWSGREDLNLRPPAPKAGALYQAALRPDRLVMAFVALSLG